MKGGRTVVKSTDLRKLVIAYPDLRDKARAIGINPDPTEAEVRSMTEEQALPLQKALLEELRHSIEYRDNEIARLRSENDRLHGIISGLLNKGKGDG